MSENPFMPQQPNQLKAPLLVGTVLLAIGIFLFSFTKWDNVLVSLVVTIVSTVMFYVLLRNFLMRRSKPRSGNREFNPKRRK